MRYSLLNNTGQRKVSAQIFRWLSYISGSFLWLGAMVGLMTHRISVHLVLGTVLTLSFVYTAKKLDEHAYRHKWGGFPFNFLAVLGFILLQVVLWRYQYFFRDPERSLPQGAALVSPADGVVVYTRTIQSGQVPLAIKNRRAIPLTEILSSDHELAFKDGYIIGIFMTPVSVHINRSPISGRIMERHHVPGSTLHGMLNMSLRTMFGQEPFEKDSLHILTNERETLHIVGEIPVYVTRIADPYVKNIVTWKKPGDWVQQGERIGLIKMGSQTDVVFPQQWKGRLLKIEVQEGQYIYAGSTPLATFQNQGDVAD